MSRIDGYGIYQSNFYENAAKGKKTKQAEKTDKTEKTEKNSQIQLSEQAKQLLEKLKKTYGNMDFIVADYETEEEAEKYLSRGTKEYSVLIEPELLEEMAADKETKEKYIGLLDEATGKLADMKEQLGDKKEEVTHLGVSIGKDGTISYFAELEKVTEKQKERIEKAGEEKKEDKSVSEKTKKTRVQASSVEELLEKIRNVDWSQMKADKVQESGSRFDCTI